VFHRVTGLGVIAFLLVHIISIMLVNVSPRVYDDAIKAYGSPWLFPMELALVGAVIYHAFNGVRIIAFDISNGAIRRQGLLFTAAALITLVLLIPAALRLILG
jgi:succinate dehydrogenase / fumarate reductase cytochrome b subunit